MLLHHPAIMLLEGSNAEYLLVGQWCVFKQKCMDYIEK